MLDFKCSYVARCQKMFDPVYIILRMMNEPQQSNGRSLIENNMLRAVDRENQ